MTCGTSSNNDRAIRMGSPLLLALLVTATAGKAVLYDTLDPDCFWHLRVAAELRQHGIGPIVDDLSFMSLKTPWTPYSWLAELGMKRVWDAAGYRGAVAVQSLMIGAIYALIAVSCLTACRWRTDARIGVAVALLCSAYLSLPYLSFRPATAALAMFAFAVWLLVRDRQMDERSKSVWMLVPLTLLMVNVHLFAVLVPLSAAALLAGSIWEYAEYRARGPEDLFGRVRRYFMLFVLTTLACLATPMLGGLIRTMWHFQSGDAMVAGPGIAELRPFYAGAMGWLAVLMVIACYFAAWKGRERLRAGEWIWLLGGTLLLFRMGRFAPIFVIIAAPIVAMAMPAMRGVVLGKPAIRVGLAALLLIGVARVVTAFPSRSVQLDAWLNRNGAGTPGYPCAAAEFVERNVKPVNGRVINEFNWGGYLAWRLGGSFQIFMDGRTQLYSAPFWRATCLGGSEEFARYLAPIRADAAIVPLEKGTLREALIALGWKRVYGDDRAEVLVPGDSGMAGAGE